MLYRINRDYDIPDFVKQSPNFEKLFSQEVEIVKNFHGKWGHKFDDELGVDFEFDTFFEAYYDLKCFPKIAVWFSDEIALSVFEIPTWQACLSKRHEIGDFFYREGSKGTSRMYYRKRGDHYVCQIEDAIASWRKLNKKLEESSFNQDNIVELHLWLDTHPEFWLEKAEKENVTWVMEDGISSLRAYLFHVSAETGEYIENYNQKKDEIVKRVKWRIEGGYHVIEDNYAGYCGTHYHDLALDTYGNTYDEALVEFAKNVWLQGQGLLKEREEKRDAWLASLIEDIDEEENHLIV